MIDKINFKCYNHIVDKINNVIKEVFFNGNIVSC